MALLPFGLRLVCKMGQVMRLAFGCLPPSELSMPLTAASTSGSRFTPSSGTPKSCIGLATLPTYLAADPDQCLLPTASRPVL